jgi:hypothetical protein
MRLATGLAAATLAAFTLTGCAGSDDTATSPEPATASATSATPDQTPDATRSAASAPPNRTAPRCRSPSTATRWPRTDNGSRCPSVSRSCCGSPRTAPGRRATRSATGPTYSEPATGRGSTGSPHTRRARHDQGPGHRHRACPGRHRRARPRDPAAAAMAAGHRTTPPPGRHGALHVHRALPAVRDLTGDATPAPGAGGR